MCGQKIQPEQNIIKKQLRDIMRGQCGNNKSMKRTSVFSVITDSVLAAACAFILTFTLVRFYTKNAALGLGLGIAASAAFGILAAMRLVSRRGKSNLLGRTNSKKRAFAMKLCTLPAGGAAKLILPATGGRITPHGIVTDEQSIIFKITPQPLSPNDICGAIEIDAGDKRAVLCTDATDEAKAFAEAAGIKIMYTDEVYTKLENMGLPDENYFLYGAARPKLKERLRGAIRRANAARLFRCGLWMTAFSYFTFFPLYYIAAGGIMLTLAAVCLIFGRRE